MMELLTSLDQFSSFVHENEACLIYFSHEECNVCKVLKPKIIEFCDHHFPLIRIGFADTVLYPEIAAQNSIFTVPAILVFFDGKEYIRTARNISIPEFDRQIRRYYDMMFSMPE